VAFSRPDFFAINVHTLTNTLELKYRARSFANYILYRSQIICCVFAQTISPGMLPPTRLLYYIYKYDSGCSEGGERKFNSQHPRQLSIFQTTFWRRVKNNAEWIYLFQHFAAAGGGCCEHTLSTVLAPALSSATGRKSTTTTTTTRWAPFLLRHANQYAVNNYFPDSTFLVAAAPRPR